MKAIILAAGSGRRLKELDNVHHKSLLKINNFSLIERQIKILKKNNISDIWVVTGYNSEKIEKEISQYGIKFLHNKNFEKTDTLESFLVAKHVMNDELITLYSDVIFEEEILLDLLTCVEFDITLSIEKTKCEKDDMRTYVEDNLVKKIDKKLLEKYSNSRYIGIARFSKNGIKIFRDFLEEFERQGSLEGDISRIFEDIIKENFPIYASFTNDLPWVNVNTLSLFGKAQKYFQRKSSNVF